MSTSTRPTLTKTLVRHGNSLALVIDRPILDLLGIGEGSELSIRTDGNCLILTPVPAADRRAKVRTSMDKLHTKYAKTLKRLAE